MSTYKIYLINDCNMVKIIVKSIWWPVRLETKFSETIGKKRSTDTDIKNVFSVSSDWNFDSLQKIEIDKKPVWDWSIDHPNFEKFLTLRKHWIAFNWNFTKEQFEILNTLPLDSHNLLYKLKVWYWPFINVQQIIKRIPSISTSKYELLWLLSDKNTKAKTIIITWWELNKYIDINQVDKFWNIPKIEDTLNWLLW